MLDKIWSLFDRKKLIMTTKIISLFLLLIVIINVIGIAYSRYESHADMYAKANVAFFVIDSGTYEQSISIKGLTPSSDPFLYTINVYNFKGRDRSKVDLKYDIKFETTTNIPLTYEIIRNETYSDTATNIISNERLRQDGEVYYKVFDINDSYNFLFNQDQTDQYTIVVHFPEIYKQFPDSYQGKVELITVTINAEQVV